MFRCGVCKSVSEPGKSPVRVVVERRQRNYPYRTKANRPNPLDPNPKNRGARIDDPGGAGWEVAKELETCAMCAAEEQLGWGPWNTTTEVA